MTDWSSIVGNVGNDQYEKRIAALKGRDLDTTPIEVTVNSTIENLKKGDGRSFVIFGEPQSGKTEMMIALNARLLDEGTEIIINLLTDSLDLLSQSLTRFRESGLSPSPKQFSELPTNPKDLDGKKWVIFCKKNARNLEDLITILRQQKRIMVIDDEADYASPNARVNRNEKTKINQLICDLMGTDGQYIGVTATPARLNLNNTFENDSELWVDFRPHPKYVGQEFFFPSDGAVDYQVHTFDPDEGDHRAEIQNAVMHFLCGVAQLHKAGVEENFTMLVHTSGKKDEHAEDIEAIQSTIGILSSNTHARFAGMVGRLERIAKTYALDDYESIMKFVLSNIEKHHIVEINSKGTSGSVSDIATPTSLFSFGAGGNIISRGVTFDNLLSMYFTRSVRGKFSQDTYIQRARMFGSREAFKKNFQLWIPKDLLANWSKCFEFHKLALEAMRSGAGAPVWLADHKTTPTGAASIDKSSVDFEGGVMAFALFNYEPDTHAALSERGNKSDSQIIDGFREIFSEAEFPAYLYRYLIRDVNERGAALSLNKPSLFGKASKTYSEEEKRLIQRSKGVFGQAQRGDNKEARHHFKIFYNEYGKARLFYKMNSGAIRFMQKRK